MKGVPSCLHLPVVGGWCCPASTPNDLHDVRSLTASQLAGYACVGCRGALPVPEDAVAVGYAVFSDPADMIDPNDPDGSVLPEVCACRACVDGDAANHDGGAGRR